MVFGGKPMSIKRRDFLCGMGCCVAHSLKGEPLWAEELPSDFSCSTLDPSENELEDALGIRPTNHLDLDQHVSAFNLTPYGVAAMQKRWLRSDGRDPGADMIKLGVSYLNGSDSDHEILKSAANAWNATETGTYIQFVFDGIDSHHADIRVQFRANVGNQSLVGRDAKRVTDPRSRTMNIDNVVQVVCEHELGHALGLLHEHQFPGNEIRWKDNGRPVIQYTHSNFGWTEKTAREQILTPFPARNVCIGDPEFNLKSVMAYWILPGWAEYKDSEGKWRQLIIPASQPISERDVRCAKSIYAYVGAK